MNFANNIKAIRKENNLSQEQLAEKLGVSRQSVSKWESNQSYPEMDKILLICKLFDCDIGVLMNDNVKEVNETKQQKTKVNKTIEDFFDYITRFVDMFMAMTFRQKIKCLFEQLFNAGVLTLICVIGWGILGYAFGGLFRFMDAEWYFGIMSGFKSVYIIVAVVLVITVLLHIFKIRYLDYYEIVKPEIKTEAEDGDEPINNGIPESGEDEQDEPERKFLFSKKREKVIIRDPEHSSSKFLVSIVKAVVLLFKVFLGFIGLCAAGLFVFITALLIASFLFARAGVLFAGVFLILASMLAVNFVFIRFVYNFIMSRKSRKNITAVILIASLAVSGVGIGLTFIGSTQFNVVAVNQKTEFVVPMEEKLSIEDWYSSPIKYVESDFDEVKITVSHSSYCEIALESHEGDLSIWAQDDVNIFETLRTIIKDINARQINSYLFGSPIDEIIVYSSKANIDAIKANYKSRYSAEAELQGLLNEIEILEYEKLELESRLADKDMIIEEMTTELNTLRTTE